MDVNIKKKAIGGAIWKFAESFLAQFITLAVTIILARILGPDDYSVISIVAIFFTFCNVFITGGLNTALIQKKNSDDLDFSTVTLSTLVVSGIMYLIMFFSAPAISRIYDKEILIPVIRVMSLSLLVNGLQSVVSAKTSIELKFKAFFYATIIASVISAIVGITMAQMGMGPWALVAQQMVSGITITSILIIVTKMKISLRFSFERFKGLFSYGWKIFVSSIISVIYDEIKPLVVGVKFSGTDLAFYNKGRSFPMVINQSVCGTLSSVLFPVISKVQTDMGQVLSISRNFMRVASYVVFPFLLGFSAVAETFIVLFLTEKWLPAAPYIKIFSFSFMFNILQTGNLQTIRAIGRSDIILKLEIIKKSMFFIIVALFVYFSDSPHMLALSVVITTLIATLCNYIPIRKLVGYKFRYIIMDILPNLIMSFLMMSLVVLLGKIDMGAIAKLSLQVSAGVIFYILFSIITKNPNFSYILSMIKNLRGKENA